MLFDFVRGVESVIEEICKRVINVALDCVFPPACHICGEPRPFINGKRVLVCPECRKRVSYIREPFCLKCGKKLYREDKELCMDCERHTHFFNQAVAVYEYSDEIKKSIYRFKYHNKREYAYAYAREIVAVRGEIIRLWKPDLIIPVPIHSSKLRLRKYNQADLIAIELGKLLGKPVFSDGMLRVKKTMPLKELSNEGRRKNLENAFICNENVVKYKKVLIVDDIYTTGSTFDECARCLLDAGASKIYCVSLCIGNGF